ncbi:O-antigen ligase family protein [Prevotella sp. 10(H)]|uniref:O-antigen ligase family protein n=1 Tax=Prevotella sp. 10(H) TaxID=1158294 RepID=UPI000AF142E7|nr:O-antigen ligase family protein [Prevotella sp. 10(H)]
MIKNNIEQILYIIFSLLLFFGSIFLNSSLFVDKEISPQRIVFCMFALIAGLIIVKSIIGKKCKFDLLSVAILTFFVYMFFNLCFSPIIDITALYSICFLLLFYFFKLYNKSHLINSIIAISCIITAIYGLLQYAHIVNNYTEFPIVGQFDNPAGFAACLAIGFPFCLTINIKSKVSKYLKISASIIIITAIVLSESRAGILSILIAAIFFYYKDIKGLFRQKSKYFLSVLFISVLVFLGFLFSLKQDSSNGRLLIWKVSSNMIKDNPVFGKGNCSFRSKYMTYQANFFKENPENKFSILADNVAHPFNEYLLVTVEYGLIGLLLCFVVIFIGFKYNLKDKSPHLIALLSIIVFACFSYPLRYAFVWLILAYCLAEMSKKTPIIFTMKKLTTSILSVIIILICALGSYFLVKDVSFEYRWKKLTKPISLGRIEKVLSPYKYLHNNWNGNPLFLYNYGAVLNHRKEYTSSLDILHQCENYFNDYDVQMLLADNYYNLDNLDESEKHYMLASNMCPNRFYPLYWRMKIYDEKGQPEKAMEIARIITMKEIKIPSPAITKIIMDAKNRINAEKSIYSNLPPNKNS